MPTHPYLKHDGPIALAHRGGAHEAPENTMIAFQASYDMGYRWFETDAHLTVDHVVVSFHDSILDRVTDSTGRIDELPWTDVSAAVVGGVGRVPSMSELFTEFDDARINIDAKSDRVLEPLLEMIGSLDAWDRVCIGSFSHSRLRRAREIGGARLCTSASPRQIAQQKIRSYGVPIRPIAADALQIPVTVKGVQLVAPRLLDSAHADGLAVHVWTIDDPAEMTRLLDMGVDGIMTDRPAVLKDVLVARGSWH